MRGIRRKLILFLGLLALLAGPAAAQDRQHELFKKLHLVTTPVTLGGGVATLKPGPDFAYLNPADAEVFLTQIWQNERGSGSESLGVLVPRDVDVLSDDGWAIIIDYSSDGYVSDADAKTIDYDKLLKEMQNDTVESSKEREKDGLDSVELLGWAKRPTYDPASHKLYWAQRLRFGGNDGETLNYYIRALGRKGVLQLNVVASMGQLAMVDRRLPEILPMVSFNPGYTYAEFDPKVDSTAGYTIAGLIAGGVLAKAGFFKALWLGILALKKFIVVGVLAAVGAISTFFKKLFRRRS
jgi:uncharacterized membrane-anchored protein